jgi:glycosyltransferase involved in cell wall biosynthesis
MGLSIGVYGARGVPSTYSGYETFLTTLLPELVERGHEVTMYCRTGEGMESTPWKGVQRKVLPALPGKSFNTLSHGLVAAIAARVKRHDVVLAVNVANAAYTVVGRATGQPTVLNTDGQEWDRGKWGNTAKKVFHGSAQIAGRCASGLIADCKAMGDIYRDDFDSDSTVIPYCAPALDWEADPSHVTQHGLTPGDYLIIAGRLNPENNIHRVAEAVVESDLELPLVVLGAANYDSPVVSHLKELADADPRIRLLGHVGSRPEFLDLLHHAKAYLHGHSVGGINPSIVEAMSVGSRVVAFDTTFNREALGEAGATFTFDNDGLGEAVRAVLASTDEEDTAIRAAAAARIVEEYSLDSVVSAYEQLLIEAAGHGRGKGLVVPTRWSTQEISA